MRRTALSAVLAATLLVTAAPAAARKPAFRCTPGRGHVIAADAQAMVYTIRSSEETMEYRGCAYGSSRSYYIGSKSECPGPGGCGGTGRLALAGTMLAEEDDYVTETEAKWWITVRNLRNGRVLHSVPTGTSGNPKLIGTGFAAAIVVKPDGAVAWITEYPGEVGKEYEVHALDSTGERLLATGTNIDPSALALAGSTLYWTQGGKPYSTTLH